MPPKKKPRITRATTPAPKNRSKRTARNQEPILDSIGTVNVQAQTQAVQTPETAATQVPHQVGDVVTCATTSSLDQRGDAGNVFETPPLVESVNALMSCNISHALKSKIINSQYFDLALLLDNTSLSNDSVRKIYFNQKGELVTGEGDKASNKITTIEKWTDAFIIYCSIYASAHPTSVQGLFKYMRDVRMGAARGGGSMGWKKYDEQFRMRRSINPLISWADIDTELWLMFIHSSQTLSPATGGQNQHFTNNKCFDYNFKGFCSRISCQYLHRCIKCSGGHPMLSCFYDIGNLPQQSSTQFANKTVRGGFTQGSSFPAPARQVGQVVSQPQRFFRAQNPARPFNPQGLRPSRNMVPRAHPS